MTEIRRRVRRLPSVGPGGLAARLMLLLAALSVLVAVGAGRAKAASAPRKRGVSYALIIGVSEMLSARAAEYGAAPLPAVRNDVALLKDATAQCGVPAANVHVLTGQKAVYAAVRDAFARLAETVKPEDEVFIALSGHGTEILNNLDDTKRGLIPEGKVSKDGIRDEELNDQAFLLADSEPGNPSTYLIDDELGLWCRRIKGRKTILIDTCYSKNGEKGGTNDWNDLIATADGAGEKGGVAASTIVIAAAEKTVSPVSVPLPAPDRDFEVSPCTYLLCYHLARDPNITYPALASALRQGYTNWHLKITNPATNQATDILPAVYVSEQPGTMLPNEPFLGRKPNAPRIASGLLLFTHAGASTVAEGAVFPVAIAAAKPTPVSKTETRRYAVVVGVNRYAGSGLPNLIGAELDAIRMGEQLKKAGYTVVLLTESLGKTPTKENIEAALRNVQSLPGLHSLLFYYSGHSYAAGGKTYLVPLGGVVGQIEKTGIEMRDMAALVAAKGAADAPRHRILILDCCRADSGAINKEFLRGVNEMAVESQWVVVASCRPNESSFEVRIGGQKGSQPTQVPAAPGPPVSQVVALSTLAGAGAPPEASEPHGAFTRQLLLSRFSEGIGAEDPVSILEAFTRTQQTIGSALPFADRSQHPTIFGSPQSAAEPLFLRERPAATSLPIASKQITAPNADANGQWAVYRDYDQYNPSLPFIPYLFMAGVGNAALEPEGMKLELDSTEQPDGKTGTCVRMEVAWRMSAIPGRTDRKVIPQWQGIGWVSGSDTPPWLGRENRDQRYYDLRKFHRLSFRARANRAGVRLEPKIGVLSRDAKNQRIEPYGDSLNYPVSESKELTTDWASYSVALPQGSDLSRICSLAFIVHRDPERDKQDDIVVVYLDNIVFE